MIVVRQLEIGELKKASSMITDVVTGKVAEKASKIEKKSDHMLIAGDNGFELKGSVEDVCAKLSQMLNDDASLRFVNFRGDDITEDIKQLIRKYF